MGVYGRYSMRVLIACEGLTAKGGQAERAKARSKTFPGIAKAMAEQWSKYLIN